MNRYMGEGPANLAQQRRHRDGTACHEGANCPLLAEQASQGHDTGGSNESAG